jgi:hypothetical protein
MRSMRAMDGCSTEGTGVGKTRVLMEKNTTTRAVVGRRGRRETTSIPLTETIVENCAQCVEETKEVNGDSFVIFWSMRVRRMDGLRKGAKTRMRPVIISAGATREWLWWERR